MAVAIVIVIILLAAAVTVFLTASRRRPTTGTLSRETRSRDQSVEAATRARGIDVDRARSDRPRTRRRHRENIAGRRRRARRRRRRRVGAGRRGRARRHPPPVPQPRAARRVGFSAGVFGIGDPRLPVADRVERLRRQGRRRQHRRHPRSDLRQAEAVLRPARQDVHHPYPKDALPGREEGRVVQARAAAGMEKGSSPSTSAACTSAVACRGASRRSGSSAPATARSTTRSARSGTARRRVVSTGSPLTVSGGGKVTIDTGTIVTGPPIGTNTTKQGRKVPRAFDDSARCRLRRLEVGPSAFPRSPQHPRHPRSGRRICCGRTCRGKRVEKTPGQPDALLRRRRPRRPAPRTRARVEPGVRHDLRGRDARVHRARADAGRRTRRRTSRTGRSNAARCLFANPAGEAYNPVLSLQCANCHGSDGGGGSTTQVIDPDGPDGPEAARDLHVEGAAAQHRAAAVHAGRGRADHHLRPAGHADAAVRRVGRWREERADHRRSRRVHPVDPADARPVEEERGRRISSRHAKAADDQVAVATSDLADATKALADAHAQVVEAAGIPATTSDADIAAQCNALADTIKNAGRATTEQATEGKACRTFLTAYADDQTAQAALDVGGRRGATHASNVSDGQLLFETYCARCHTQGWSIFDPTQPNSTACSDPPAVVAARVAASASTSATATPNGGSVRAPPRARSASTRSSSSSSRARRRTSSTATAASAPAACPASPTCSPRR